MQRSSRVEHVAIGVALVATLAVALVWVSGCTTVTTIRSDNATWQDVALASCRDMQVASEGASAAVAWTRVYYPDRDAVFKERIDPLLVQVIAGVDVYCAGANAVWGAGDLQAFLARKAEIVGVMDKLAVLLAAIRGV